MALGFLIIGVLCIVSAVRGNIPQVAAQLNKDFTPSTSGPSFWTWIAAILVFAVIGKAFSLEKSSKVFILLIVVVYTLSQNGIFGKFTTAVTATTAPAASTENDTAATATTSAASSSAASSAAAPASATGAAATASSSTTSAAASPLASPLSALTSMFNPQKLITGLGSALGSALGSSLSGATSSSTTTVDPGVSQDNVDAGTTTTGATA
jgi:hypothetical protein